jgi:hypothetical protein
MAGMEIAVTGLGMALLVALGGFVWEVTHPERKRAAWLPFSAAARRCHSQGLESSEPEDIQAHNSEPYFFSAIALHTFAGDMGSSVMRTPTAR